MKTFAFIFARSGSKGLKKKNIKLLNNKPLICYSIDSALENSLISKIFISTDDKEIMTLAETYKNDQIHIISRPPELATDTSAEYLSWKHAIEYLEKQKIKFDRFISLPATSPFRNDIDITNVLNKLTLSTDFVVTMTEANRSPYFNMVKSTNDYLSTVIKSDLTRRQDCPKVYDLTTVAYASRPQAILKFNSVFEGRVKGVLIPKLRSLDIDDEIDFSFAEFILKEKLNASK
ncbi:acylneuraminate cytidylyltransferase [Candidatus Marinamargulisbacteria bacterium SCGC AG-410-N11]|nr:acylneuraminate cytidylyltransferase [Candidatus Marinamargulisbacteria bacterium SCGC AG-410-N11]